MLKKIFSTDRDKDLSARRAFWILMGLYAVAVIIRYLLGDFPKFGRTYPDELNTFDIARSLFYGEGIRIQGYPSGYQKLGYSLAVLPFYAISNAAIRVRAITLFHCLVLCSMAIWTYLLGREWGMTRRFSLFLGFLALLWPNQLNSMNLMIESLYVPLFALAFWLFIRNERRRSYGLAILIGIISYYVYFIKERGFVFPAGCIALEVCYPVLEWLLHRKEAGFRVSIDWKRIRCLLVQLGTFLVIFLLVKNFAFRMEQNSWWALESMAKSYDLSHFLYGVYSFFYYLLVVTMSVFCLPMIFGVSVYTAMEEQKKRSYLFLQILNVGMSLMVSFRITAFEDYGRLSPRLHLRYFGPQIFLTLAIFLVIFLLYREKLAEEKRLKMYFRLSVLMVVVILLLFKGLYRGSAVDHYDMHWLVMTVRNYPLSTSQVFLSLYSALVVMSLVMFGFYYCYRKDQMKYVIPGMVGVIVIFCLINNASGFEELRTIYGMDAEMGEEVMEINEFMVSHTEAEFLVVGASYDNKLFNTYADEARHAYIVDEDVFWANVPVGLPGEVYSRNIADWGLLRFPWSTEDPAPEQINYIVITKNNEAARLRRYAYGILIVGNGASDMMSIANGSLIYDGDYYSVYENLDPNSISVARTGN